MPQFRRLAFAAFALAVFLAGQVLAETAGFVSQVEDLPLMPGLTEVSEAGVVFDSPSGRIVEAYAEGTVSRAAVLNFYKETLPQLGWNRRGEAAFDREGEVLTLDFTGRQSALVVRFTLKPQ